jgi:hypothetical protein
MSRATENTDERIRRIECVFNLLEQKLKKEPNSTSFIFNIPQTDWGDSSLKDLSILEKTLNRIKEATQGEIDWEFKHKIIEAEGTYASKDKNVLDRVIIDIERPSAIKEYRRKSLGHPDGKNPLNKIASVDIYKTDDESRFQVYVNGNYDNQDIKPKIKKYWSIFYEVASDGSASSDVARQVADYFNTRRQNPIYKYSGCELTEILLVNSDILRPNIPIKTISRKTESQRKNKTLKNT